MGSSPPIVVVLMLPSMGEPSGFVTVIFMDDG
jgi:hypothetical protein